MANTDDDDGFRAVREQEAPQARLLRLAGLYDKLTDAARHEAFAEGRAKDAWTRTAIAAQRGGTEAPKPLPGYAPSDDGRAGPPTHEPDQARPQYARELLAQCQLDPPPLPLDQPAQGSEASGSKTTGSIEGQVHESAQEARQRQRQMEWAAFLRYAEAKERELWTVFHQLDQDGDGILSGAEVQRALTSHNIHLSPRQFHDLITSLSSSRGWHAHLAGSVGAPPTSSLPSSQSTSSLSNQQPSQSNALRQPPSKVEPRPDPSLAYVTWPEFRDYLLLLPRQPTVPEIVRFYKARKLYGLFRRESGIFRELASGSWAQRYYLITTRERGGAGITSDGDSDVAGNMDDATRRPTQSSSTRRSTSTPDRPSSKSVSKSIAEDEDEEEEEELELEGISSILPGLVAFKYLLAGGVAGGISRSATAPFDRLKVFLITQGSGVKEGKSGTGRMAEAARTLYVKGDGLRSFWVGNGLNVVKIFPESAIKFFSYETIKRAFAQHVDGVNDPRDISPRSRFLSGGLAGIMAQLSIYPVETVKTVMMSSSYNGRGDGRSTSTAIAQTVRSVYSKGGFKAFYRGLPAGLVGVFPYSAIDMSTFEGTKLAYLKASGRTDLPMYATLMIGSISGSVGAITVFPLNVCRTRLQASGTPAHPLVYDGFVDVFRQTYVREGVRGYYRGLAPTLAKVIPSVAISYTVYEQSKKFFGVL